MRTYPVAKELSHAAILGLLVLIPARVQLVACIWDADTLADERKARPKMAEVILHRAEEPVNPELLRKRIQELLSARRDDDPEWCNALAGAHLRLGEAKEAIALLEPAVKRLDTNYGVHANLGTAYHLAGRYREAEKEIARDLEINPNAHFGLERYHLALLQYLIQDTEYQKRHVYVDEWSASFSSDDRVYLHFYFDDQPLGSTLTNAVETNVIASLESALANAKQQDTGAVRRLERELQVARIEMDPAPPYRYRWNLASDPKFTEGIIYMATLNQQQPACFVLLGIASLKNRDLNLAAAAFQRAIDLGSPQADFLRQRIDRIHEHIREARAQRSATKVWMLLILGVVVTILIVIVLLIRRAWNWSPTRYGR